MSMGGPMTGNCIYAVASIDAVVYFKTNQDECNTFVHHLLHQRSGPDQVPGNLFPAWEIYFPGINNPIHDLHLEF